MSKERSMTVLFLTKYSSMAASYRQRFLQYIPYLESAGIKCQLAPLFRDHYLKKKFDSGKSVMKELLIAFAVRLKVMCSVRKVDLIVIQYELFPYFTSTVFERYLNSVGIPYIVDYDDAIYHQYENHTNHIIRRLLRNKIKKVMNRASVVIAANEYIAEYARSVNDKVAVIPTIIDVTRYTPLNPLTSNNFTIGWIGSPSTAKYIKLIEPALLKFCRKYRARIVLVGSGNIRMEGMHTEIREWSEDSEVENIHSFDVGIMPLDDTPWEKGKCGFKLIQYMGCGKPVIASPVGVNTEIIEDGVNGFLAQNEQEWFDRLSLLKNNHELKQRLGMAGRKIVEEKYSLQVWAPEYVKIIREALCAE